MMLTVQQGKVILGENIFIVSLLNRERVSAEMIIIGIQNNLQVTFSEF